MNVLPREAQNAYKARCDAIDMYNAGACWDDIIAATGKDRSEVRRLILRCLILSDDGSIWGYRALIKGVRIKPYTRVQAVNHSPGSGSGGCAGALSQLLARFPDLVEMLCNLYFKEKTRGQMPEARESYTSIHDKFLTALRKLGLTDSDWPFNTADRGYKTIYLYLRDLETEQSQRAVSARHGLNAARRGKVGTGYERLFPALRPYGAVQLDYHKIDAASVLLVENDHGEQFEVPLSRWHFGLMVEEFSSGVIGYCVELELTPSSDGALEAVSSAIVGIPAWQLAGAGEGQANQILIGQLLPELAGQCFSVLKVDNGWANAAHEVVNNIIGTVGSAVNFGPPYVWARRDLVERLIGEFTRRGLQRLPSTYGAGPQDTRVKEPAAQAAKFRIKLKSLIGIFERCISEHNQASSEGMQWSSPVRVLRGALDNSSSGLFSQPLPEAVKAYPALMMHVEEVVVKGSLEKNIRPYFNLDRHKHTNHDLSKAFWLIGKTLVVSVDRRLARLVYATVKETGQALGQMYPSGPWADSDCSWRDRKLLMRSGKAKRMASYGEDPLEMARQEGLAELKALGKAGRRRTSRVALNVAKIERQQAKARAIVKEPDMTSAPVQPTPPRNPGEDDDPSGLYDIPSID
ncbi:hypothetical protein [Pseudoduganella rhizocola]|uniref:hypothetical protein n=1 Tax=Pseudoduganella rhizocola TaxID=3382643 RepID=UPI0038B4E0A3